MAKNPLQILNEMARPKKSVYDPDDPKSTKNAKPLETGPASDPFNTKKRLGKVIKYAAGVIAADVARLAGTTTTGKGRPTKAATAAKEKKGKGLSSYSDKDEKMGIRDITLVATVRIDGKTKKEEKLIKDAKTADLEELIKNYEKELYKKYDFECDIFAIDHKMGEWETSDTASNYERGDVEGGEHKVRATAKK